MESSFYSKFYIRAKPFLAVLFLQFGYAGMSILSKLALNKGFSPYVFVVYRHAIATMVVAPFALVFDRKKWTKMTFSIFVKILLLGLLEPTLDRMLYYIGMKYTSATFAAAMGNVLPAFAFLLAWIFRLEKVNFRKFHSWAKILGTIITVGGAMFMTVIKGPIIDLPWTNQNNHQEITSNSSMEHPIKGALMITIGCFCWAGFMVLQAITLKSYPAELSLSTLICLMGTIESSIVAISFEWGNAAAWSIGWDAKLLGAAYSGVMGSGVAFYISGVVMKERGPVFVTAFNPLNMIIVAILGSFLLSEIMYLGRVIGAIVIVIGLYLVLWGKCKDQNPSSNIKEALESSHHCDQQMSKINNKTGASIEETRADQFV